MTYPFVAQELPTVSVIIPTTCEARRGDLLLRAVETALAQADVAIELLVIVNGTRYDSALLNRLKADHRLEVIYLEKPNYSAARYIGVQRVKSQYFCFLDDDDELLPEAVITRVKLFLDREGADAAIVVTNGLEHSAGKDVVLLPPEAGEGIARNPGNSFVEQNWFASCAPLFKTASIDPELFNFSVKYFEWTYLFFVLLSKGLKFRYRDVITYRINKDNPFSISKSIAYEKAAAEFIPHLLKLPLDAELRRKIGDKYAVALNTLATLQLAEGHRLQAWSSHLTCLRNGGWRFLPFTRRLLLHSVIRTRTSQSKSQNQFGTDPFSR